MKLPAIDLSGLIKLLKSDGQTQLIEDLASKPITCDIAKKGVTHNSFSLLSEWDNILMTLDREVIPLLSKGCEANALIGPIQKLAKSAKNLSLMASQILSFVPGPIGIVCSIINAIGCFATGNIAGGFFELLGCIPGGKVAGKASSKLFPKVEKILIEIVQSNPSLKVFIDMSSHPNKVLVEFFEKYAPKVKKPKVGYDYGVKTPSNPSSLQDSLTTQLEAQREIAKYRISPGVYGNMGKTNLWPHL